MRFEPTYNVAPLLNFYTHDSLENGMLRLELRVLIVSRGRKSRQGGGFRPASRRDQDQHGRVLVLAFSLLFAKIAFVPLPKPFISNRSDWFI